jgi:pimeloyl-ACP methyl ester carboxylesterase
VSERRTWRPIRVARLSALIAVVLAEACSGGSTVSPPATAPAPTTLPEHPAPSPAGAAGVPPGSAAVRFVTGDGVHLAGRLFGTRGPAVVLSHQSDDDQTAWWDFASVLSRHGYQVLTFNDRGVCGVGSAGCSGGMPDVTAAWKDTAAAARFLHDRGAGWVALIGASMGGEASVIAASKAGEDVDALVSLSGSLGLVGSFEPAVVHRTASAISAPALYLAGRLDGTNAENASRFARSTAGATLKVIDTAAHGIDLLGRADVRQVVMRFLEGAQDAS